MYTKQFSTNRRSYSDEVLIISVDNDEEILLYTWAVRLKLFSQSFQWKTTFSVLANEGAWMKNTRGVYIAENKILQNKQLKISIA